MFKKVYEGPVRVCTMYQQYRSVMVLELNMQHMPLGAIDRLCNSLRCPNVPITEAADAENRGEHSVYTCNCKRTT